MNPLSAATSAQCKFLDPPALICMVYSHMKYVCNGLSIITGGCMHGMIIINYVKLHLANAFIRGGSRVWKEGGHLAEKQLKTKKKKKKGHNNNS